MTRTSIITFLCAVLAAGSITFNANCQEQLSNPLLNAAESSNSWFQEILAKWDIFVEGRERNKLKQELKKLEIRLGRLRTTKLKLKDQLLQAGKEGLNENSRNAIESSLTRLSKDLMNYTDTIGGLAAYVPEIKYPGATNSMTLPTTQLTEKRKILRGLWESESEKLDSKLTEAERQKLRQRIEDESDKAIKQLDEAINKVSEIRKKL